MGRHRARRAERRSSDRRNHNLRRAARRRIHSRSHCELRPAPVEKLLTSIDFVQASLRPSRVRPQGRPLAPNTVSADSGSKSSIVFSFSCFEHPVPRDDWPSADKTGADFQFTVASGRNARLSRRASCALTTRMNGANCAIMREPGWTSRWVTSYWPTRRAGESAF